MRYSFTLIPNNNHVYFINNIPEAQIRVYSEELSIQTLTRRMMDYRRTGFPEKAVHLFKQQMEIAPKGQLPLDVQLLTTAIGACIDAAAWEAGREFHLLGKSKGIKIDAKLGTILVKLYGKSGYLTEEADSIFQELHEKGMADVMLWTSMIDLYRQSDLPLKSLQLFKQKQQEQDFPVDSHLLVSVLGACGDLTALEEGRTIHRLIRTKGINMDPFLCTALITMYGKCGCPEEAYAIFKKLIGSQTADRVAWNAMVTAYRHSNLPKKALELFLQMQEAGILPNNKSLCFLLESCADINALEDGRAIHHLIRTRGIRMSAILGTALIAMYGKCGCPEEAYLVFRQMLDSQLANLVSWNAMITAYGESGFAGEGIQLFEQMRLHALKPNDRTFVCLLNACSHGGRVEKAKEYFHSMKEDFGITPSLMHYACIIDVLARAGHLTQAESLLLTLPETPNAVIWTTLLSACRTYGDVDRAENIFQRGIKTHPENASLYIMMGNIYYSANRTKDAERVSQLMRTNGITKLPSISWIEIDKQVHSFHVSDNNHPARESILQFLQGLNLKMKEIGYVPNTNQVTNKKAKSNNRKRTINYGLW